MKLVFLSALGYDNDLSIDQERWIEAYLDFQNLDQKLRSIHDGNWPPLLEILNTTLFLLQTVVTIEAELRPRS